jgi:hypothetical protein
MPPSMADWIWDCPGEGQAGLLAMAEWLCNESAPEKSDSQDPAVLHRAAAVKSGEGSN